MTRWILVNCCIRFCCVCSRPAVSTMHTSAPVSMAAATARWATLAGSLPAAPVTISAPSRSAQIGQLLDGRGAERVGRRPARLVLPSAVNIRPAWRSKWSLPAAVDAGHHDHGRPAGGEADRLGRLGQQRLELLLMCRGLRPSATTRARNSRADLVDDLLWPPRRPCRS